MLRQSVKFIASVSGLNEPDYYIAMKFVTNTAFFHIRRLSRLLTIMLDD